jgi:hypothetical protein
MTAATAVTARDVLAALYHHFGGRWAMLTEVTARAPRQSVEQLLQRARTGEDIRAEHERQHERQHERHRERRIDALLVRSITGHKPGPLPVKNVMDAFWRAGRAEALMKGLVNTTTDGVYVTGDAEELRARVAHLTRDVEAARNDAERAREQRDVWRRRYAAHEPPTCCTCGQPLHPARSRHAKYAGHEWEHRDEIHAVVCDGLRRLAAEEAHDRLPAEERRWRRVEDGGPQPGDYRPATTDGPNHAPAMRTSR